MRRLIEAFHGAALRFSLDGCAFLAQAIAFNAMFAIFPLVVLAIAVLAFVYGTNEAQGQAVGLIASIAPGVEGIIGENIRQIVNFRSVSGIVGLVVLVWSGKNLFMALSYALNRALGIEKGRPLVSDIAVSLIMLPVLGIILIIATAVPIAITLAVQYGGFPHASLLTQVAGYASGLLLVFAVSMLLYTYLPNRRMPPGFALPGALFTSVAWEVAQIAFGIYTAHVNFLRVYGALSTLAILLLWFYYMGIIFLYGAQLSARWWAQDKPA